LRRWAKKAEKELDMWNGDVVKYNTAEQVTKSWLIARKHTSNSPDPKAEKKELEV